MEQTLTLIVFLITFIPVMVMMVFMPYLTRKTESFGVSIPGDVYHSKELTALRKQYALVTGMLGTVVIVAMLVVSRYVDSTNQFATLFTTILILFLICAFAIYVTYHSHMKRLKTSQGWHEERRQQLMIDTRFRNQKLTISNAWFILPFLIALGTLVMTLALYDRIPQQIPIQYDLSGQVTSWADKSYRTVMAFPALQFFMIALFAFINTIIARSKQQTDAANPQKSIQQNIIFRRRWSIFIFLTGTAIVLLFSLIQLSYVSMLSPHWLIIAPIAFGSAVTIGAIVLSFITGQGGSRVKVAAGEQEEVIDRDDDRYWKLGQFYFNPDDPALFLEKRFGVGWTINLARPFVWIILIIIVLAAFLIPFVFLG